MLPDPSRPLDEETASLAFQNILSGDLTDAEIGEFLVRLSDRGETVDEIVAAASVLRQHMLPISAPEGAIDVCGTGGDGSHTRNISTAVAFVVAGAGVPMAKHGNRAASSRSGASDVLHALGWNEELSFDRLEAQLHEIGIVFLHAPRHHPAIARVAPVRRALGRRTIFNLLGPISNPARVKRQMLGVFAPAWQRPLAEALHRLGSEKAMVVHGGGLDELTVHDNSAIVSLDDGGITEFSISPETAGLRKHAAESLRGGSAEENAEALKQLFAGHNQSPEIAAYRDIVLLNAAAALLMAGVAGDWAEGARLAAQSLDDGAAADKLSSFLAFR